MASNTFPESQPALDVRSESQPPTAKRLRPEYVRSHASLDYHPALLARAKLGDTRGAVYLPSSEPTPISPGAVKTPLSLFGDSKGKSPQSKDCALNELEVTPCFSYFETRRIFADTDGLRQHDNFGWLSGSERHHDACESTITPFSGDAYSSAGPTFSTPATSLYQGSDNDERLISQYRLSRSSRPTKQDVKTTIDSLDGACDETPSVRFSSNDQQTLSQFLDPFTGKPVSEEDQMSDVSSASGYLRPNAFAGHRDTLARILQPQMLGLNTPNNERDQPMRRLSIDFSVQAGKRFAHHRDTLARLHFSQNRSRLVPTPILDRILKFLSFEDYKSLRLTCRQWHDALPCVMLPPASRLPAEVLHQIYEYLQPCDFDAARHTCRSWFLASLDRKTGRSAMKRAGCHAAFNSDIEHRRQILHTRHLKRVRQTFPEHDNEIISDCQEDDEDTFNEEWLISKRLATESRLSARWHGSGLSSESGHSPLRLTTTDTIDFRKLAFSGKDESPEIKKFTVSGCGRFVLVTSRTDIFVYSLDDDKTIVRPCVRLVTGREILSVSMDSRSGRYAVGALFQGRIGMCWELDDIFAPAGGLHYSGDAISLGLHTDVQDSASASTAASLDLPLRVPDWSQQFSLGLGGVTVNPQTNDPQSDVAPVPALATPAAVVPFTSSSSTPSMHIRTEPSNIYKNLGSSDDEAQSVAICPTRKCIAFGCKSGIELHWVDGLTGRDLNRWFPLAAPSDFLYFLPQRPGIDSATKLRIISSSSGLSRYAEDRKDLSAFRTIDCDHFRAVPLSDGTHMLFTDPATGLLCLGSDAPVGGPTKLVRKVCMIPPTTDQNPSRSLKCYAVGQDLGWGVRVVASYDDGSIILYNIPSDYFERIRQIRSSLDVWDAQTGMLALNSEATDGLVATHPDVDNIFQSTADPPTPGSQKAQRSLRITGAFVCRVERDVEDLQVDCHGGGLRVWVFHHSGKARKMDVYAPRDHQVTNYTIEADGTICSVTEPSAFQALDRPVPHRGSTTDDAHLTKSTTGQHIKFVGLDGASDYDHCCAPSNLEGHLAQLEESNDRSRAVFPNQTVSFVPQAMLAAENEGKLQLQVLTDFRNQMLLSPYMLNLD